MLPEIHLGPLTIQTFGICFAMGFLVAAGIIGRRFRELGEPADWTWELTFSVMVGGLVGSRVDYMLQNWSDVKHDFFGSLFSGSGLVWYGGVIGGGVWGGVWGGGAGLGARGGAVGAATRLARLEAAGPRVHPARAWLCDRAHRLPALRRRRLRNPQRPAVGDGVSEGHRADQRRSSSDAHLRDAGDGDRCPRALAVPRSPDRRALVRALPGAGRARAFPGRVHPPQRRRCAGADAAAAALAGDGRLRCRARRACAARRSSACVKSRYFLHLAALSSFALAQPLFAKLGPAPGYFAAHGMTSLEVVLFAVALIVLPPVVLFIPELIVVRRRPRWIVHLAIVAALAALIVLPPLGGFPTVLAYVVAGLLGIAFAAAYAVSRGVRAFTTLLALAPVFFLAWLLLLSPT